MTFILVSARLGYLPLSETQILKYLRAVPFSGEGTVAVASHSFLKQFPKHLNTPFLLGWTMSAFLSYKEGEGMHIAPFFCTEHLWCSFCLSTNAQNRLQTGNKDSRHFWFTYLENPSQNQQGFASVDGRTTHSWLSCKKRIKFQADDSWYHVYYQHYLQLGLFCLTSSLYFSHNVLVELQNTV